MPESLLKAWSGFYTAVFNFRALWILLLTLFLAFGFGFRTPSSQFEEIRMAQDTFRTQQYIQKLRIDSVTTLLKSLSIAQCIDRLAKGNEGRKELQLMQMPCNELLRSR